LLSYYERWIKTTEGFRESFLQQQLVIANTAKTILDWKYYDQIITIETTFSLKGNDLLFNYSEIINHDPALPVLTHDVQTLKKLYNDVSDYEQSIHQYNSLLRFDKNFADSLIMHIKKEYHLE